MTGSLTWIEALALMHGTIAVGLTVFVVLLYLLRRDRLPMLLISLSYILLTLVNVWGVFAHGRPDAIWFWVSLVSWMFGELGLWLYIVFGPPRPRPRLEVSHDTGT